MGEPDRRDDISAAFDKAEAVTPEPTPQPTVVADTPIASPEPQQTLPGIGEPKSDRVRNEDGTYAKAPKDAPKSLKEEIKATEPKAATPPVETTPKPVEEAPQPVRKAPPKSLGPVAREMWDKVPPEVQQAYLKRDSEAASMSGRMGEAVAFREKFSQEIATPYDPLFRAAGVEPIQGIRGLLQSYAALETGQPGQKAQLIAQMIQRYLPGDEGINLLANTLTGAPQQNVVAPNPTPYRDPRVDEMYQMIQQAQQRAAQTVQQQAADAVAEVENEEFYDDVRNIMADMVEVAARNGLPITPREAYNRATLMHPDVSRVVEQRRMAASQNGTTQQAMRAASSVRSSPASGVSGTDQRDDLRATIEAAWGAAQGR